MTLISGMIERAKANKQRIVLPEGVEVKVGDVVLFAKYSGTDVKLDDTTYKILSINIYII